MAHSTENRWNKNAFRSAAARKLWALQYGAGSSISNPFKYAMMRDYRKVLSKNGHFEAPAECLICLQSRWDCKQVCGTRMGGLPGHDRTSEWPRSADGTKPLTFLAQFDFSNCSIDLPIDDRKALLHVYCENLGGHDDMNLRFQWHIIEACGIPTTNSLPEGIEILAAFSSTEYLDVDYAAFDFRGSGTKSGSEHRVPVLLGTKIGGHDPLAGQITYADSQLRAFGAEPPQDAKFLCSIGSVCPTFGVEWPFCDSQPPLNTVGDADIIEIGDGWAIAVYVNENGELFWRSVIG